jgi:CheY-like chemotaxis protein
MSFNTALIVDDSKLARIALKRKLEQRGLQIVMAEDAAQALGLLQNTPIDIVFMDHLMPEMDGFEATREIKANAATAHVPVIMCSGKEKEGYLEEARAIGASNVLPKPAESAAIDAVFAELEQLQLAAAANQPAAVANQPAAAQAANVAEPQLVFGENEVMALLQPLAERVDAMVAQVAAMAQQTDERISSMGEIVQAHSAAQDVEPFDASAFAASLQGDMDQRIAALAIPDAGELRSQMESSLSARLQTELGEQWNDKLSSSMAKLQATLEQQIPSAQAGAAELEKQVGQWQAQAEQRIGDRLNTNFDELLREQARQVDENMHELVQSQLEVFKAELAKELPAPAPALDLDALKAELLAAVQQTQAANGEAYIAAENVVEDVVQDVADGVVAANAESNGDESLSHDVADESASGMATIAQPADEIAALTRVLQGQINKLKLWAMASSVVAVAAVALHWL